MHPSPIFVGIKFTEHREEGDEDNHEDGQIEVRCLNMFVKENSAVVSQRGVTMLLRPQTGIVEMIRRRGRPRTRMLNPALRQVRAKCEPKLRSKPISSSFNVNTKKQTGTLTPISS